MTRHLSQCRRIRSCRVTNEGVRSQPDRGFRCLILKDLILKEPDHHRL